MLEKNNSVSSLNLNLQPRASSLERPLVFGADKMLSVDDDLCRRPEPSVSGSRPFKEESPSLHPHPELLTIENEDAEYLVGVLGLNDVRSGHPDNVLSLSETERRPRPTEDTKNILRNFGNAQNQYSLYNPRAQRRIRRSVGDPARFHKWIRRLRLENFQQFKQVWTGDASSRVYTRLYRELCWDFYTEEAVCYVLSSRMKNEMTKVTHLKYIYRFLEGIVAPSNFYYFKKQ